MNNARRKAIAEVQDQIGSAVAMLEAAKADLESLRDEEQEYLDNMPESLQGGEKGEAAQAAVEKMDEAINAIEEFLDADADGNLNEAAE